MATKEDRSLSSGMPLPKWMKVKMSDRFDFDKGPFSPTELDESFMFYYRKNSRGASEPPNSITSSMNNTLIEVQKQPLTAPVHITNRPDFSKHTPFCQKFIHGSVDSTTAQEVKLSAGKSKTKSSGVDDGFKGEAAKCGSSVIRVAHQMVSGKVIRGFNTNINEQDCDGPPEGFNPAVRRGSKSLPASPLTSPKTSPTSTRRINRYFTGPFVDAENHHGSWILSNLLGKRQNLSQSVGVIPEEHTKDIYKSDSVDDVNDKKKRNVYVPRPSELREMNFLSPTSM